MKALLFVLLAPRNVVIALVKLYRRVVSPLYGDVCRYYPSCSAYGLGQFQQRGVLVGSFLTAFRILRCNPWSQGGVDEVKPGFNWFRVTDTGYVVPNLRKVD